MDSDDPPDNSSGPPHRFHFFRLHDIAILIDRKSLTPRPNTAMTEIFSILFLCSPAISDHFCQMIEALQMLNLPSWLWAVIVVGGVIFGYFSVRGILWNLRDVVLGSKNVMNSGSRLFRSIEGLSALRSYSPKTEALIDKISASEDGQFVLNSGVLSQEEIGSLSRLQLANFLSNTTQMIELVGRQGFTASMPQFRESALKMLTKVK